VGLAKMTPPLRQAVSQNLQKWHETALGTINDEE
jgi:hypothetical protein